ncbi:NAD(P)-dependent dehydrogenase, short-chain alcohol dehydrogenase family [Natribacillus halophilus]|uniref:NAD(P)-dependent dehydrogenase, short-chain alcohol dehydrogenase family n=2 Tax=Natribacillus halophilus TaxID=549003 RepID=A0A1G8SHC3_9BACI|nr:NAD(P)-dependent dehydrogenase, short-chain alcohol dehydrogenase family [Natribacillus halophilus]
MEALAAPADITDPQDVSALVDKVEDAWGQIDILVNNAGICPAGPLVECTPEEWDQVFSVNARGVYLCTRAVLPAMQERKQGAIISIASNAGKTGEPFLVPYSASKFAVVGFTQALAREVAPHKIRVNCVCPAMAETNMMKDLAHLYTRWRGGSSEEQEKSFHEEIPWGRMTHPEDVANAVLFLASSQSEFFTGQALNVSGGLEMH